jgi:hypothetical protein
MGKVGGDRIARPVLTKGSRCTPHQGPLVPWLTSQGEVVARVRSAASRRLERVARLSRHASVHLGQTRLLRSRESRSRRRACRCACRRACRCACRRARCRRRCCARARGSEGRRIRLARHHLSGERQCLLRGAEVVQRGRRTTPHKALKRRRLGRRRRVCATRQCVCRRLQRRRERFRALESPERA